MRIALFGTFDVENYGDLLFPIIAARELTARLGDTELVRYSYNEKDKSSWCYEVRSLAKLAKGEPQAHSFDVILIGGGHLIRFDKTVAPGYIPLDPDIPHPTGYWLAPALAGIASGRPVLWNAPGASDAFPAWAEGILAFVLNNSAYVALRDRASADAIRKAGFEGDCKIVPDTAFGLARHFSHEYLRSRVERLFASLDLREKYIVIQATEPAAAIATALFSRGDLLTEFDVLALPIGPVLGDDPAYIRSAVPQAKYLPEWPSPEEIAGLIAHSAGVVAQSLHLSITALAYGAPVLRSANAKEGKYAVLQASDNVYFDSSGESDGVGAFAQAVRSRSSRPCAVTKEAQRQLQEHWDRIAEICQHRLSPSSTVPNRFATANWLLTRLETLAEEQQALLAEQTRRTEHAEGAAREAERARDAVYASTLWRATRPLRSLGSKISPALRSRLRTGRKPPGDC